ncbi:MAG: hypothetical protein WAT67_13620 [Candidatus Contendobacter sp.]
MNDSFLKQQDVPAVVGCCCTQNRDKVTQALEIARHELTTLHGLVAVDAAAPLEPWRIDTSAAVTALDQALNEASCADNPLS